MIKQIVYQIHFEKVPKELYKATSFDARFYHNSTGYYFEIYVNDKLFYKQGTLETEELMYSIADEFMANFNAIRKTELSWEPGKNEPEVVYRYLDTSQNINLSMDHSMFERIAAKLFDTPVKDVDPVLEFIVKFKEAVENGGFIYYIASNEQYVIDVKKLKASNFRLSIMEKGLPILTLLSGQSYNANQVYFSFEEAVSARKMK